MLYCKACGLEIPPDHLYASPSTPTPRADCERCKGRGTITVTLGGSGEPDVSCDDQPCPECGAAEAKLAKLAELRAAAQSVVDRRRLAAEALEWSTRSPGGRLASGAVAGANPATRGEKVEAVLRAAREWCESTAWRPWRVARSPQEWQRITGSVDSLRAAVRSLDEMSGETTWVS